MAMIRTRLEGNSVSMAVFAPSRSSAMWPKRMILRPRTASSCAMPKRPSDWLLTNAWMACSLSFSFDLATDVFFFGRDVYDA